MPASIKQRAGPRRATANTSKAASRDQHHHAGLEHLPPEIDQRVAHLVGIAGHARDHLADAVAPVIGEIEPLDLDEDALAQG
jgi:hypothetical protein